MLKSKTEPTSQPGPTPVLCDSITTKNVNSGPVSPTGQPAGPPTTLVAAVPTSSAPHNRANNSSYTTLPLKLTAYDEKKDFSAWLRRSRFHAGVVPPQDQSMAIVQSLTVTQLDKALDAGLSEETPLAQLCSELENLLQSSISKREALYRMYSRRRLIAVSAKDFADGLYCLCKAAFSSISPADCNDAVVYHFIKYIEPSELRRSLLLQPPHDLQDANSRVNHYSTLPHSDLPRQSFLQNNQAQNWQRDDGGNHNRPGPFNRFQYPRRGEYNRFGNPQVCACHSHRSNPSNELAGSGSTEGARTPTPVAASSSTLPVLQPASDRDYIV
nr:unnamed protein product [Spirometra erinaceieuropaei]